MVWALNEYQIRGADVKWLAWVLTMFAGLTMVSNFKYYSGKDINPRKSVSFPVVVAIALAVVALVAVSSTLPEMLFMLFVVLRAVRLCARGMGRRQAQRRAGRPTAAPALPDDPARSCQPPAKPFIFCTMSSLHQAMCFSSLPAALLAGLLLRVAR